MRLLVRTCYTGSFDDPCELTHVLVDIDPRHQLDKRATLFDVLAMPQIYSVTFFDYTPQVVSSDFLNEEAKWFDEEAEVLAMPADVSVSLADFRIEAPTIRYMPGGIMWHFYEKYGGGPYETATIPWKFIQAAAAKKRGPKNGQDQISHKDRSRDR